jgi:hypothetical protein
VNLAPDAQRALGDARKQIGFETIGHAVGDSKIFVLTAR